MRQLPALILVCFLVLCGCGGRSPTAAPTSLAVSETPTAAAPAPPTLTVTPRPTAALTQTPSPQPTSSPAPTSTSTVTPTPTPTLDPMSIQAMRAGSYPGGDIVIEKELARGANYRRYYASYPSEGLKIYALLTVPDGAMPEGGWPAIVFNHGYIDPKVYRTTERYIAYVDNLARSGYVVFRIDYRGHDQSEGAARGAYGDPGYTVDVLNAVSSIQHFPQVNPHKIGMWGHSLGGFLTLRAMVISKEIKVGVIWSGVVGSYSQMLYNWRRAGPTPTPPPSARGWRGNWIERYGAPEQNPAFWNSISANAFLADLSGPLQLHHSLADAEVPYEFSASLARDIQSLGGSVELFTYQKDDHNLSASFTVAMSRTLAIYDRVLKNK